MECPRWWTIVAIIFYLSIQVTTVFCQNVAPGGTSGNIMRDCSRPCGNSASTELLNSILTVAASNGVLPDLLPMLQGQSFSQDFLSMPLSVVPMPSGCVNSPDSIIYPNQVVRPSVANQNVIYATAMPSGSSCSPNTISNIPQPISLPALPPTDCVQQIAQAVPLENYPTCAQNVGVVRPMPIVLQPQCQFNEVNPYNVYNQIVEPISLPEVNMQPPNMPILPPPQILPAINSCSGTLEVTPNLGSPCPSQPIILTSDGQPLPLNLQINVPTPNVPPPRITVVSANPANIPISGPAPCLTDPAFQYPPQPPIVVGGCSRSSWRKMLPILLVALLSDRGCNSGGGSCCCCSCNSNSGNNIPIPYPIPIPVNNPIINTCPYPYSSRNREYRDDGDDEERKRK